MLRHLVIKKFVGRFSVREGNVFFFNAFLHSFVQFVFNDSVKNKPSSGNLLDNKHSVVKIHFQQLKVACKWHATWFCFDLEKLGHNAGSAFPAIVHGHLNR